MTYVDLVWHTRTERAGSFTSSAAASWELVFSQFQGETIVAARGPETKATQADFPADAEFFGITFKLGAFMPHLPIKTMLDRQDVILPQAGSRRSFWLNGSAWELPTIENVDVFISRLIRQDILVRDREVESALHGRSPALSPRSLQYRFVQATGLAHKTIQQIERARRAAKLLEHGTRPLDAAFELGYFDQAHLTNSLRRFIGKTPVQIVQTGALALPPSITGMSIAE
ncbi:MAG: helix-turn-helix domain-containing protein [Anaerolinea sp.]|nr:helix-turn-helix domain-containing protein [Anaerolinea sp.]